MKRPWQSVTKDPYKRKACPTAGVGSSFLCFVLVCFTMLSANSSLAQDLGVDAVLHKLEERSATLRDVSFLLKGQLIDADGTEITLEIEVQAITEVPALRAYFIQPDALADNFVVLDNDKLYNYLFVTNQAMLFDASDPDALGGLLPQDDQGNIFTLSLDLEEVFSGFRTSLTGYVKTPAGNAYILEFENIDGTIVTIGSVHAQIVDEEWYPYRLTYFHRDGRLLFDLVFEEFQPNRGLATADVTFIPGDAEIIDERH
jgi:hypothetical protein